MGPLTQGHGYLTPLLLPQPANHTRHLGLQLRYHKVTGQAPKGYKVRSQKLTGQIPEGYMSGNKSRTYLILAKKRFDYYYY